MQLCWRGDWPSEHTTLLVAPIWSHTSGCSRAHTTHGGCRCYQKPEIYLSRTLRTVSKWATFAVASSINVYFSIIKHLLEISYTVVHSYICPVTEEKLEVEVSCIYFNIFEAFWNNWPMCHKPIIWTNSEVKLNITCSSVQPTIHCNIDVLMCLQQSADIYKIHSNMTRDYNNNYYLHWDIFPQFRTCLSCLKALRDVNTNLTWPSEVSIIT